jgi:hypothetical protein
MCVYTETRLSECVKYILTNTNEQERERERRRVRQTDRQTDRQTERQ